MISPWAVLAGGAAAGGLALLLAELRPAPPDLGQALGRLHTAPDPRAAEDVRTSWYDRIGADSLRLPGARIPHRQLALVGRSPARFMAHKLLFALAGLVLPGYLTAMAALGGISLTVVVPLVAGPLLAALLWFVPDGIVAGEAKAARTEYLHGIAADLELVALERAADCGPAEALRRAAADSLAGCPRNEQLQFVYLLTDRCGQELVGRLVIFGEECKTRRNVIDKVEPLVEIRMRPNPLFSAGILCKAWVMIR